MRPQVFEQEGVVKEDVEEEETDKSSESSSNANNLKLGARLLRQYVRDKRSGLQRYIKGLERGQGRCGLCQLDREAGRDG